eukprot:scaffold242672_cov27-Tisochrysis_lutea.AAC.3
MDTNTSFNVHWAIRVCIGERRVHCDNKEEKKGHETNLVTTVRKASYALKERKPRHAQAPRKSCREQAVGGFS